MTNPLSGYAVVMPRTPTPASDRALSRTIEDDGCLIYTGSLTNSGYGKVWKDGKDALAHRVVWEATNGPIPPGMQIDHLCRRKQCLNVGHMEVVTPDENMRRTRKTHCKRGHDFAVHARPMGRTRQCWECHKMHANLSRKRGQ